MEIKTVAPVSYEGMYKVTVKEGLEFFIRAEYLSALELEAIHTGSVFSDDEENELLDAGLAGAAELKAVSYLARAEQSRFGLKRKLLNNGQAETYVDKALDYLENKGYLSDERYSRAWLNDRKINHCEGKAKLQMELQARGINRTVAIAAVEEFFTENDEEEICKKACERFVKKGKSEDKLIEALLKAGFSYKLIKRVMESN